MILRVDEIYLLTDQHSKTIIRASLLDIIHKIDAVVNFQLIPMSQS